MRFATRTFLLSFVPFAMLLAATFWTIQSLAISSIRDELRSSLRQTQMSMARARSKSEFLNSRFLTVVGDNAPLKAGMQLMLAEPSSGDARRTVEDQLREICNSLGFDFLLASGSEGRPMAGVMRSANGWTTIDLTHTPPPQHGFFTTAGTTYEVTSVPIDQGDQNIGSLSVGERFDFSEFTTPAVLTLNGKVLKSSVLGASPMELERALNTCSARSECELRLHGQNYLSLPMDSIYFGNGYILRSLQNLDAASGPVQSIVRKVFVIAGAGALLAAVLLGLLSSRSIVRPIAGVVARLRESTRTSVLPEFPSDFAAVQEIRELTQSFNHAAAAVREGKENLRRAYLEFVGSLASALDARDRYTAGHSLRVSEDACAIARAMNLPEADLEEIRIGALLHDIGKIGIGDTVLQKSGKLTAEEFQLIQQHPTIGRRILEGVNGFHAYLPVIELHHENWDGTGYPHGLAGESVPVSARIVHVADAYDAMTSDRPYRPGMSPAEALRILRKFGGTQFDAAIVEIFSGIAGARVSTDLDNLASAVRSQQPVSERSSV